MSNLPGSLTPVTAICINITPIKTVANFQPDPYMHYGVYMLTKKLSGLFSDNVLEFHIHLYQIFILVQMPKPLKLSLILKNALKISSLVSELNKDFRTQGFHFYFSCHTVIDYQQLPIFPVSSFIYSNRYLYFGNLLERCMKISQNLPPRLDSSLLITHKVYEKLSESMQNVFPVCYYIMHICCFSYHVKTDNE